MYCVLPYPYRERERNRHYSKINHWDYEFNHSIPFYYFINCEFWWKIEKQSHTHSLIAFNTIRQTNKSNPIPTIIFKWKINHAISFSIIRLSNIHTFIYSVRKYKIHQLPLAMDLFCLMFFLFLFGGFKRLSLKASLFILNTFYL